MTGTFLLGLGRHGERYAATKHHQAGSLGAIEECWEDARCRSEGQGSLTVSYVDSSFGYHHVYMLITITISLVALAHRLSGLLD